MYMRVANGQRQRVDGFMYIKKVKAKCEQRLFTEGRDVSINSHNEKRSLYLQK